MLSDVVGAIAGRMEWRIGKDSSRAALVNDGVYTDVIVLSSSPLSGGHEFSHLTTDYSGGL